MTRRAAIVLAGGKGERFQTSPEKWQDKALAPLFGKPLLIHGIENVKTVVDEVAVCVNDKERKKRYADVLRAHQATDVKLLVDEKFDGLGGPLVAIYTGLKHLEAEYCLTLPGDMPLVRPRVLEYMFEKAKATYVVVPMWPNGRLETLVMVLERKTSLQIAETLCLLLRPRSDDIIRGTSNVVFVSTVGEISQIDPELKSFVNINSPKDLATLQPRRVEGAVRENLQVKRGVLQTAELKKLKDAAIAYREGKFLEAAKAFSSPSIIFEKKGAFFWTAVSRENEGKSLLKLAKLNDPSLGTEYVDRGRRALLDAADAYGLEAEAHEKCRCLFLADRARRDKLWCEERAKP
jgi:molybdopterin-guanine dinucleotide biosynthesis protein A